METVEIIEDFKSWEELTPLEKARCTFWDMYKAAYNFRPRHINTSSWTLEDFDKEFKDLAKVIQANDIQQQLDEEKSMHDFETRVQMLMSCGAKTREQAIKWIHEAEGSNGDNEYLCFLLGLPYRYFEQSPYLEKI